MGYTDSSWCSDVEDRKSTIGYVFMLGGAPVAWSSRKEPVVALSSCEIEYITASLCACCRSLKNITYAEEPIDWNLVKEVQEIIGKQMRVSWANS